MGEFDPKHSIKLVVDEWGSWHPEGTGINPRHQFEQMGTLRDALVAALTLDIFNRHADKVDMTNVAQLVNNLHSLFLADGDQFVATPTYHVYTMYRPHQAATGVKVAINAPAVGFQAGGRPQTMFRLAGSASRTPEKRVTLTLVHTHANEPADVLIRLAGGSARQVTWSVLTDKTLNAHNAVVTRTADPTPARGGEIRHELPPASINRFDIDLA
jgi:alpha-N-arabinofuranosidase